MLLSAIQFVPMAVCLHFLSSLQLPAQSARQGLDLPVQPDLQQVCECSCLRSLYKCNVSRKCCLVGYPWLPFK